MMVDSSGGGDWDTFGRVGLGFELETEPGIGECECLVSSTVLTRIGV